jgi:hypothetical protein
MAHLFEVRDGNRSVGSFSSDQIRQLADDGTLNAAMQIRRLPDGAWAPLSNVKGLRFKPPPAKSAAAVAVPRQSPTVQSAPADFDALAVNFLSQAAPTAAAAPAEIECPYCSELIKATAKKCKHCGEFLDGSPRTGSAANAAAHSPRSDSIDDDRQSASNDQLESIAAHQQRLRFCGLAFFTFQTIGFMALVMWRSSDFQSDLAWWSLVSLSSFGVSWLFNYAAAVFAFFLAVKVYDAGMGTVLGLLGLVPYVGPVGFLLISAQATSRLRQHRRHSRPRGLAVIFSAAVLTPTVFLVLALAFSALFPGDAVAPGPAPIFILLGTAGFFGMMLVLAILQKE